MWASESQLQGRKWKWARWRKHLHGDTCSSGKTQREWRMTSAEMRVSDLHHGRSATLASLWNKRHKDWTSASSDKIRGKIAHDRGQSILIKKKVHFGNNSESEKCDIEATVARVHRSSSGHGIYSFISGQVLPVWMHNEPNQSFLHVHCAVGCTENCSTPVREAKKLISRESV